MNIDNLILVILALAWLFGVLRFRDKKSW